ncbi:MAG: GYD domain-containing protein [Desulfobacterales bacterium]|nr:GYD domain-containing protein [Desulfobacterales bacterium]
MPTFVSLVNLTDQGAKNIKESPQRFEAFQAMAGKLGIKIKSVYYTQGQYDMVVILEGSDEAGMLSLLNLVTLGNARFQTMRGFSVDEMKGFISKMS